MTRPLLVMAAMFAATVPLLAVQAQQNSLVGTWQVTHPADNTDIASVFTQIFSPDGSYFSEVAWGSDASGRGSGTLRTRGSYRLVSPTTVEITFGNSEICTPCRPTTATRYPAGSSVSFDFRMQGNRWIEQDGTIHNRIQ